MIRNSIIIWITNMKSFNLQCVYCVCGKFPQGTEPVITPPLSLTLTFLILLLDSLLSSQSELSPPADDIGQIILKPHPDSWSASLQLRLSQGNLQDGRVFGNCYPWLIVYLSPHSILFALNTMSFVALYYFVLLLQSNICFCLKSAIPSLARLNQFSAFLHC